MPSKSLIQLAAVAAAPTALLKWHRSIARAVNRTRQYFRVYDASDADAAVFRARQLQTVLQLSPVLMLVNVFTGQC
jgi:hypothetical protein